MRALPGIWRLRLSLPWQQSGMRVGEVRDLLISKTAFLLRLMENPNLLEHEQFTPLLMATFHLTEELRAHRMRKACPIQTCTTLPVMSTVFMDFSHASGCSI